MCSINICSQHLLLEFVGHNTTVLRSTFSRNCGSKNILYSMIACDVWMMKDGQLSGLCWAVQYYLSASDIILSVGFPGWTVDTRTGERRAVLGAMELAGRQLLCFWVEMFKAKGLFSNNVWKCPDETGL